MGTDREGAAAAGAVTLSDGRTVKPTLVGGVLTKHASAFVGSRLFTPCGPGVLVYGARTAKQIAALPSHRGQVTAVCAGPPRSDCPGPLATGTALGEVRLWDSKGLACLGRLELAAPVHALRWPSENTLVVVLGPSSENEKVRVERIEVVSMSEPKVAGPYPLSAESAGPVDAAGDAVALADGSSLLVCVEGRTQSRRYPHRDRITAVAVDPHRRYVAVGDEKGVIWIWWGILDAGDDSQRVPARWHWHAHPVRALAHCGPVLLSGGDEGVLCIRNVDEESTHFVPRLPSAICHIASSANGKHLCLSLEENSLGLIDGLHGWVRPRMIHGLDVPVSKLSARGGGGAALHTMSDGQLAASGGGRKVQFLDEKGAILGARTLMLDRGGCTTANADPMERWQLQQIVFSAVAKCLLTCETRRSPALQRFDEEGTSGCVLKWWVLGEDGRYTLDSVAHDPHEAEVTVALAQPLKDTAFVTASLDGTFKSWDRLPVGNGNAAGLLSGGGSRASAGALPTSASVAGSGHCWQCVSMGSWHARPVLSGCFSADGSTLVLGFHGFAVLWDHDAVAELKVLPVAPPAEKVTQLCSTMACGRFLLLASLQGKSHHEVVCWDLVTLDVVARVALGGAPDKGGHRIRCVAPPHGGGALRLLGFQEQSKTLKVWSLSPGAGPEEPLAVQEVASASLPQDRQVLDAAFAPGALAGDKAPLRVLCWTSAYELWGMNLSKKGKADAENEAEQLGEEDEEAPVQSKLARVLGSQAAVTAGSQGASDAQALELQVRTTPAQQSGLVPHLADRVAPAHVPSHMLPAPAALWASFVSVYGKPAPRGAGLDAEELSVDEGQEKQPGASKQVSLQLEQDAWDPFWLRPEDRGNPSDKSEFVDAHWMDQIVSKALKKAG